MGRQSDMPIETPWSQRALDFRVRTLPVLVWTACALVVAAMLFGRAQRFDYVGLAQSLEYEISPSATGVLESVVVDLYDVVEAGDMVAKLDDEPVLASIATVNATIRRLQADLEAARAEYLAEGGLGRANWTADLRRFQMDEEQRRLDLLALRVEIESDQVELERLEIETRRAQQLLEAGLISRTEYDVTRLSRDQIRERLEENQILLAQTDEEYRAARQRRLGYEAKLPEPAPDEPRLRPLQEAIEVEGRRLREIELLRESLVLRSPVRGQVTQVLCRRGQSVVPGEPIVMIAERDVREIVTFLAEDDARVVEPRTAVLVSSRNRGGTVAESVVLRVGPTVQALPQRLWRDPRLPDYGRAVVIAASPVMGLQPGERVNVKFPR